MRRDAMIGAAFGAMLLAALLAVPAAATEEYAARTGKGCSFCHRLPDGGPLNPVGVAYVRNNYRYPIPERILDKAHLLSTPLHRGLRALLGYLHLVAASIFVGTIFYVHVLVRPARMTGGIPRGERILGLSCMAALTATGVYLTWYRLDSPSALLRSNFGVLLMVKLILFGVMVVLGLLAVTVVSRRIRAEGRAAARAGAGDRPPGAGGADDGAAASLSRFDGRDGRPAYVRYGNTVYDVTGSERWKDGVHFRKHAAGSDLTADLAGAPHGAEVFESIPVVATVSGNAGTGERRGAAMRIFIVMAYVNLAIVFLILACVGAWLWGPPVVPPPAAAGGAALDEACVGCHARVRPGIYEDWRRSVHAKVGVGCGDCHAAAGADTSGRGTPAPGGAGTSRADSVSGAPAPGGSAGAPEGSISTAHLENSSVPVTVLVTPARCGRCHGPEAEQYARSKHAHTVEIMNGIDRWLRDGMNNRIERTTGCFACHGSVVSFVDGRPVEGSWPNVGVGRVNPDGSLGSCTSCHTRHRFSTAEARKPEACDQCHLGPDHPQIEIYNESKHGTIYHAEGDSWRWRTDDLHWIAGRDYRAPTCAACHLSEAPGVPKTHDATERLSWELQAPLTVRPEDFRPFPASTSWMEERGKMQGVCSQCHSGAWTAGHFDNLDRVVENYNETYFGPVQRVFSGLYDEGLLSREPYFDEKLEWEFYEFWHHEGRRARMGAAMMAPDYAWWHGFYELKHRFVTFMQEADRLRRTREREPYPAFPGRSGD